MTSLFLSLFSFRLLTLIKHVVGQTVMSPRQDSVHLSSEVEGEEHHKPCCFNKACPSKITISMRNEIISTVPCSECHFDSLEVSQLTALTYSSLQSVPETFFSGARCDDINKKIKNHQQPSLSH
jgi:hypothetical protein